MMLKELTLTQYPACQSRQLRNCSLREVNNLGATIEKDTSKWGVDLFRRVGPSNTLLSQATFKAQCVRANIALDFLDPTANTTVTAI